MNANHANTLSTSILPARVAAFLRNVMSPLSFDFDLQVRLTEAEVMEDLEWRS